MCYTTLLNIKLFQIWNEYMDKYHLTHTQCFAAPVENHHLKITDIFSSIIHFLSFAEAVVGQSGVVGENVGGVH